MSILLHKLLAAMALVALLSGLAACGGFTGDNRGNVPLSTLVEARLKMMGTSPGEGMMIRIFKETSELEVWKETASGEYRLFQTYKICAWSGDLGPKIVEGDRQSPEGFYTITPGLLNPHSNYYLAFNTGFPNKYDRAYGRTGSDLMVHGDCSSRGCYAMTDAQIKEIYALARESFAGGNRSFQLQIFPFRLTPQNLARHAKSPHIAFWKNIKTGYDQFELTHRPPTWDVCEKKYVFNVTGPDGKPLDAVATCPALTRDATLTAELDAKQAADEAAFSSAVANLSEEEAKAAAAAQKAADEKAAIAARGQAIGNAVGGMMGIFGDSQQAEPAAPAEPDIVAPKPAPRLPRG